MLWICLALVAVSLAISLPSCVILVRAGHRLGLLDQIGSEAHKKHERVVPNTGGIGIFAGVAIPMAAALTAVWLVPESWWSETLPAVAEHIAGLRRMTPMGAIVLAGIAGLHVLGLIDDRKAMGPFIKLAAQVLVAAVLVLAANMRVLEFLDPLGWWGTAISVLASMAWFIVIINAFNFLDNMDGLSGGVAAIIAALYLASTLIGGQWFVAAMAALLLGSLVGFLVLNFPPARVFMGDGGSLVVGTLLAVISVRTTYFDPDAVSRPGQWYGILMPLMIMAVPLYDFTSVTLVRLAQGRSPFRGDQSHFSHRLVGLGLSRRRAVGVIWLCTVATGLSGVMLGTLDQWQALIAGGQTAAVLALLAILEHGAAKGDR